MSGGFIRIARRRRRRGGADDSRDQIWPSYDVAVATDAHATAGVSLAETMVAFSLAIDLGLGQPMNHVLRSWQLASRLGRLVGLPEKDQATLFHVAILAWVGCVADAAEVGQVFGDDIAFRADSFDIDVGGPAGRRFFASHVGRGLPPARRAVAAASLVLTGGARVVRGLQGHCVTASSLAGQLGLQPQVATALRQFFARWDGKGVPRGVGGTDLVLPVRLVQLADVVEVHARRDGTSAAVGVARARRGTQFDPDLVDAFCTHAADLLAPDEDIDAAVLIARVPSLSQRLAGSDLDHALESLADFTDVRCPARVGHSRGVASLARTAAEGLRLPSSDAEAVHRAGLLHEIGLHGVPSAILDPPGALSTGDRERIRAGAYYTERVLARLPGLAAAAAIAGAAHERMDGSGYHRGVTGASISLAGRILAAACAFHELLEPRATRPALTVKAAAVRIRADVAAGRLDAGAADAVLAAAGAGTRRRTGGPAGLTEREVEVLRLVARGSSTRQIAAQLGISARTAGTHIERIYTKIGVSTRSTATLFALRNGLLDPLEL